MWRWRTNSLTFRLTGTLIVALVLLLIVTATVQIAVQTRFAMVSARLNGLATSEALYGALHTTMLGNDREGLRATVRSIAERSPTMRVRVTNKEGVIVFSSDAREEGQRLDPRSEACFKCHQADRPIEKLPPGDRTRIFEVGGVMALGMIRPIENEPACTNAACHAHPAEKRLLGVLDVTAQLPYVEATRRETTALMLITTGAALLLVIVVVLLVVRRSVHGPIRALTTTLETLGAGDYSARAEHRGISEFDHLGESINTMARDLERANAQLVDWAQTLERRVEEKTAELRQAQEQMLRVERMASLGKLAAVVAHEINNPLASVVTYAKLLVRRVRQDGGAEERNRDTVQMLEAIASESARCGEIVSNLLLFARRSGSRMEPTDVNKLIDRSLFLLKHKMDLAQVRAELHLATALPPVVCDPAQVEQVVLALAVNAIEAMPEGGVVRITTGADGERARLVFEDAGIGMDAEVRSHIFEPFFTTKGDSEGKGLGLGLAVVYGIVQRHGGTIDVDSEPGHGSRFTVTLPLRGVPNGEEE